MKIIICAIVSLICVNTAMALDSDCSKQINSVYFRLLQADHNVQQLQTNKIEALRHIRKLKKLCGQNCKSLKLKFSKLPPID